MYHNEDTKSIPIIEFEHESRNKHEYKRCQTDNQLNSKAIIRTLNLARSRAGSMSSDP